MLGEIDCSPDGAIDCKKVVIHDAVRRQVGRLSATIPKEQLPSRLPFVMRAISTEIALSLAEAGFSWDTILYQTDASDTIREEMERVGFTVK